MRGDGTVRVLSPQPLFSDRVGQVSGGAPGLSAESGELERGRVLELRDGDFRGALRAYRAVLAASADRGVQGEALAAIARVQAKAGSSGRAIDAYRRLISEFGALRMAGGYPLGVVGRLELSRALLSVGDTIAAQQTWLDLHRRLLRGDWSLTRSEFDFFTARLRESVDAALSGEIASASQAAYRDTLVSLAGEETAGRLRTEEHLEFEELASRTLSGRLDAAVSRPGSPWTRVSLDAGSRTYSLSVRRSGDGAPSGETPFLGVLFDQGAMIGDVLTPTLAAHATPGAVSWVVRGRDGESILASEEPPDGLATATASLASDFLPWTLELYRPQSRFVETFLTSRRGVYFYAFLLLTGILVFGLTLTARSVTHQLELARMKSDFVSTVSHEFKSPLTAIRQLAEMLQSERVRSDEQRRRYYNVLVEQSERLSTLVDNVLDLARIDEGRYELERSPVDVGELLAEIVERVEHRVHHEGFTIRSEIEDRAPVLNLDATAITQATTNLIDNGVKYSGDSREVVVRGASRNGHFVISVEDFGIGLAEEERTKVFERFYRGGSELTRNVKGTGLGLTLVKEIAEAHGGSVAVESEPGGGSIFTIHVPLEAVTEEDHG